MTVQKRKHYEERIAHANGAEIETKWDSQPVNDWKDTRVPAWYGDNKYRVNPDCEYAIEEIRKLGGDEAVEYYLYWLGGGELEFECQSGVYAPLPHSENPFKDFSLLFEMESKIRKKKRTVTQVLWVKVCGKQVVDYSWIHCTDSFAGYIDEIFWHKVPTCTREVEVD